jgi:hypothetical protein
MGYRMALCQAVKVNHKHTSRRFAMDLACKAVPLAPTFLAPSGAYRLAASRAGSIAVVGSRVESLPAWQE